MCPRETETHLMPDIETVVVDTLEKDPVPGSVLVAQFAKTYGEAQVRNAIWSLIDRGRVELTWSSRLHVIPQRHS